MNQRMALLVPVLCVAVGCSSTSEGSSSESEDLATHPYKEVTVHFGPNGEIAEIHERAVALDQAMNERKARRGEASGGSTTPNGEKVGTTSSAITVDSTCNFMDFVAFDQPNFRGNALCLHGAGNVDLRQLTRRVCASGRCFTLDWTHAIRSWETGPRVLGESVWFTGDVLLSPDRDLLCEGWRSPYQSVANVPTSQASGEPACAYYSVAIGLKDG